MKHSYAEQSPRGFGNEINTYRFKSKKKKTSWFTTTKTTVM